MTTVGRRVRPVEWEAKTSGTATYAADMVPDGLLVGRILRSPHAYARIRSIDTSAARRVPGVHAVVTAADLPAERTYAHVGPPHSDRPLLARDVVRYVGEEVAAVAAESEEAAEAAMRAIVVRYRPMRAPLSVAQARAPRAAALHARDAGARNVSVHMVGGWGDADAARAGSAVSVEARFHYPRINHACMEPSTTLAWWHADEERLELWTSTQSPFFVIKEVALAFGLEQDQVVCRDVAVGGGFGSKSKVGEHEILTALLSRVSGRPVLMGLNREEEFAATKPRHDFSVNLRAHATQDGRLSFLEADLDVDNGAYNHFGPMVMAVGVKTLGAIYGPDAATWDARLVDTALPPGGQFRGYGMPQVSFAMESLVDELAERQGVDPLEYRIRNANEPGTVTLNGSRLGSARLVECLEAVREAIDWVNKKSDRKPHRGVGVAAGMHGSGSHALHPQANRSEALVTIDGEARVEVLFGGADAGTGQRTILAQIAAEELGVPLDSISVVMGDTERAPFELGAWSSRGTHMGGHSVSRAAVALGDRLRTTAARLLDCSPEEVKLGDGFAHGAGAVTSIAEVVAADTDARDGQLSEHSVFVDTRMEPRGGANPRPNLSASYTFAAHAVEVEVDPGTGEIRILDYVAAHDIGRALNPTQVEGQVVGGVVQGLGAVLGEEMLQSHGRSITASYLGYPVPRAADVPRVRPLLIEGPEPAGPYDAKSVGEMSIVPPAAAVANAVYDAIGIRLRDLPFTPDKVLNALRERDGRTRQHRLWRRPDRWQSAVVRAAYPLGVEEALHKVGTRFARSVEPTPLRNLRHPASTAELLQDLGPSTAVLGGGTDLHEQRRQRLTAPLTLLSVRDVAELRQHTIEDDGRLVIGAGVLLHTLEQPSPLVPAVVAEAVSSIASAQIRAVATVGGNLVQAKRCWFFRSGFDCYKRGGASCPCYAVTGDHRFYHAAVDAHRCQAVTPSDLATSLVSLDGLVALASADGHRRELTVETFFTGPGETALRDREIVSHVVLPSSAAAKVGVFRKLRRWEGDFAMLSLAVTADVDTGDRLLNPRVVFGALAPTPWSSQAVQDVLDGRRLDDSTVEAATLALDRELDREGHPLERNEWKLDAAVGLLRGELNRLANRIRVD
jgi:CO/xanthine dehydrogenase Mo-binding subunit/CO/xanthine dehydrogenase FAD-binding subunit